MSGGRPPGSALSLGVPLALLLGALALDLRVALRADPPAVPPSEMSALLAALSELAKPGDVTVHSPLLRVSELSALGELVAKPDRPSDEVQRARRVVVLDRADHPMRGFIGRLAQRVAVGERLELRVYEPEGGAEPLLFDLFEHYRAARMWIERPPGTRSAVCDRPRPEGGFGCPGEPDWLYLAPRSLRVSGAAADCVWAHPTTGGVVVIELPLESVPEGRRLSLVLEGALDDSAASGDGVPVENTVVQGGRELGRVVVPNRTGWYRGSFELSPGAPVQIRVTASHDGRRHHCLRAKIQELPSP